MNTVTELSIQDIEPVRKSTALATATPGYLLQLAVEQGADLDRLERLMALQERWEANEARKAYVAAMAAFKREPIDVYKSKMVGYRDRNENLVGYSHATLSDVTDAVGPVLARHGLSYRWNVEQSNTVAVECVLTHELGHSESIRMVAPPDASGKKNAIQQIASAVTYLQRYTLLAITGTSTKDYDDDGAGSGDPRDDGDTAQNNKAGANPPVPAGYFTEKRVQSWSRSLGNGRTHQDLIDHLSSGYALTQDDIAFINNIQPIKE